MIFLKYIQKNQTFSPESACDDKNTNITVKKLYAKPREHSAGGTYSLLTGGGFASREKSKYLFNLAIFAFGDFISS